MSEITSGSDGDRDARIVADAFASFRETQRDVFPPPPVTRVYTVTRQRQRLSRYRGWLATAVTALPAVVLLATGTTVLNLGASVEREGGTAVVDPTPSTSPTPSRSRTPQPHDPTSSRSPTNPPGGVRIDLLNATIELPPLGRCAGGQLDFSGGQATDPGSCGWRIGGGRPHYANLDGMPGPEAVTTITAGEIAGVVALRLPVRDAPGGPVRAMGYVMVAASAAQSVAWTAVSPDGLISVRVTDASYDLVNPPQQTRGYRWKAPEQAFVQVEGPTGFPDPSPPPDPEPSVPVPSVSLSATL